MKDHSKNQIRSNKVTKTFFAVSKRFSEVFEVPRQIIEETSIAKELPLMEEDVKEDYRSHRISAD